ncbi:MAG: hypothetical protein MI922_18990 [Bacteroidales bacterium]|nr:hypothetical protein [Bacteroidales bacterium]
MYSKRTGLILGFHGCDEKVRDSIVANKNAILSPSENNYDWLGNGVYFWENNYTRALKYAHDLKKHPIKSKTRIKTPSVLGAIIDLGHCLDLLDSQYLDLLKMGYKILTEVHNTHGLEIPQNKPVETQGDLLLRNLDCAVIEMIHQFNKEENLHEFDSVRGVFWEGQDLYPNAGFKEKNHIQIAIRNPNCIKGFFIPRELNNGFPKP